MDDLDRLPFLAGLQRTGIRPGLGRMQRLVARLGHPERACATVLVTGTNGKGSTSAMLDAILRAAGHRVGLFTSPHLVDVRERIRIDGKVVDEAFFAACGVEVRAAMEGGGRAGGVRATFFEALSAIGFLAFARAGVRLAVVEIGMGGRLDSTNVADPVLSVLTNVSLDHAGFLGPTVDAIAAEKVEVARTRRPFVTAVEEGVFNRVVGPRLAELGALPIRLGLDFRVTRRTGGRIDWKGRHIEVEDAALSLRGSYQATNAAVALAAAEALSDAGFAVDAAAMRAGLAATEWPGRMQRIATGPDVWLDGCHNPGAADRLAESLADEPLPRPLVIVHGSKAEKDWPYVLSRLAPFADAMIETTIPGLANPAVLAAGAREAGAANVEVIDGPMDAVARARCLAAPGGSVLVTGSLYLVGAVLGSHYGGPPGP